MQQHDGHRGCHTEWSKSDRGRQISYDITYVKPKEMISIYKSAVESQMQKINLWSLRFGYDWVSSLSLFTFMHWRRKWQPTPVFLPGESQGREAWWAAVYGVTQSRTRLKWLSSSSSNQGVKGLGKDKLGVGIDIHTLL